MVIVRKILGLADLALLTLIAVTKWGSYSWATLVSVTFLGVHSLALLRLPDRKRVVNSADSADSVN